MRWSFNSWLTRSCFACGRNTMRHLIFSHRRLGFCVQQGASDGMCVNWSRKDHWFGNIERIRYSSWVVSHCSFKLEIAMLFHTNDGLPSCKDWCRSLEFLANVVVTSFIVAQSSSKIANCIFRVFLLVLSNIIVKINSFSSTIFEYGNLAWCTLWFSNITLLAPIQMRFKSVAFCILHSYRYHANWLEELFN